MLLIGLVVLRGAAGFYVAVKATSRGASGLPTFSETDVAHGAAALDTPLMAYRITTGSYPTSKDSRP